MKYLLSIAVLIFLSIIQLTHSNTQRGLIPLPLKSSVQDFIFDTEVVDINQKNLKADISFLFIDFKYMPVHGECFAQQNVSNHIKICEFGSAKAAGLGDTPCDMLIGGEVEKIFMPGWPLFWQYLSQLSLPVWVVGVKPADHKSAYLNKQESNEAWDVFVAMGGRYVSKIVDMNKDPEFTQLKHATLTNVACINAYKGIIIYRRPACESWEQFNEFRKKYSQFLYLDHVGNIYAASKSKGISLFQTPELQAYKPRCGLYKRQYTKDLAQRIENEIKSDMFVIKPVFAVQGHGIIVVDQQNLDKTLRYMCGDPSSLNILSGEYESCSHTYSYWKQNKDDSFIVEQYCPSKPMFIHDKFYDPTVRVYFVLRHDQSKIYVNILAGYAKIPPKSLSDNCSLSEKHKTTPYYKSLVQLSALTLPEDVFNDIKREMKAMLPKIYLKMLEKHNEI